MATISIREVAARAGVSRATVSRVLNPHTEALVAAATRERVQKAARELGYHPSAVARGLAGRPMNSIGVVLAYILPSVTADPYLGPVLDGILDINKRRHQKTVIFTENHWREALANLPHYADGHCDGLILVIPPSDCPLVPALKSKGLPFVIIGDSREDDGIAVVDVDNVGMSEEVVSYLIAQGHRRIAILCGNREFASSHQRLTGYRRALATAGILLDESLIRPGEYWEWSGHENAIALMTQEADRRPTALFCSNGRIATGALRACHELGLRVPEDVSVAAVSEYSEPMGDPALTIGRMPLRLVGERAVETLLAQIHEDASPGRAILLPGDLVVRQSVAPLVS